MSERRRFPNPFYVVFVLVGAAFVFTCLGYLVAPSVAQNAAAPKPGGNVPSPASIAVAAWFDRWGATALTVEVVAMIALGCAAMFLDHWFSDDKDGSAG